MDAAEGQSLVIKMAQKNKGEPIAKCVLGRFV